MNIAFDLHTHTLASGHAYSTLQENLAAAKTAGLQAYGFSDHAQAMPGSVQNIYFLNFKVLPKQMDGVYLLGGIELNILDYTGDTDGDDRTMDSVDYAIASLHPPCIAPGSMADSTSAILGAMKNPRINIIGHPDDSRFPLDYDAVVRASLDTGTVLEVNNSSLGANSFRPGARENYTTMLELCVKHGAPIILGSDSHYAGAVGRFDNALALLNQLQFPEHLVLNTKLENLNRVLNNPLIF